MRDDEALNQINAGFLGVENSLTELRRIISLEGSLCEKISSYNRLIKVLADFGDHDFIRANFEEFIPDFINTLKEALNQITWSAELSQFFISSQKLLSVIPLLPEIRTAGSVSEKQKFLSELGNYLNGKQSESTYISLSGITFPVIEYKGTASVCSYLQKITVKVLKTGKPLTFHIHPSVYSEDDEVHAQVRKSFYAALSLLKKGSNTTEEKFDVYVTFQSSRSHYAGNSFGLALALQIYQELAAILIPDYVISPVSSISLTGGIDETGDVSPVGERHLFLKMKGAAFSFSESFIIPSGDYKVSDIDAFYTPEEYPSRKLSIIPVSNIGEILNRRDLISIRRKPFRVRGKEFIKRHFIPLVTSLLFFAVSAMYFFSVYDDNPAGYTFSGREMRITNNSGRVLWSRESLQDMDYIVKYGDIGKYLRIIDADDDGTNEVLLSYIKGDEKKGIVSEMGIALFNKNGDVRWQFRFEDTVYSFREGYMETVYGSNIFAVSEKKGKKILFVGNNNAASFAGALIRLDLQTGKRLNGTLWNPGHYLAGAVIDDSSDKTQLLIFAANNGYENATAFVTEWPEEDVQIISTDAYELREIKKYAPSLFMRFPKNDYEKLGNYRGSLFKSATLYKIKDNLFSIISIDPLDHSFGLLIYRINTETGEVSVFVDSRFRVTRDSLVAQGVLKPPYTDTQEYKDQYVAGIKYYVNGEWVNYNSYHAHNKAGVINK